MTVCLSFLVCGMVAMFIVFYALAKDWLRESQR